jgi:hypothetical protein
MAGFLDLGAPSVEAEYVSYLDDDILGKMIFKSAIKHLFQFQPISRIQISLARHSATALTGDAKVPVGRCLVDVEIKCAKVNIASKNRKNPNEGWMFCPLLRTKGTGNPKRYDLLFAVGILTPASGAHDYWRLSENLMRRYLPRGMAAGASAFPHSRDFLRKCGFFVIPQRRLRANHIDLTISVIERSPYARYFAWGYDLERCQAIWRDAIQEIRFGPAYQLEGDPETEPQAALPLE